MKKIQILLVVVLMGVGGLMAQTRAITQDGQVVVLYEDGTWKYLKIEKKSDDVSLSPQEKVDNSSDEATEFSFLSDLPANYTSQSVDFLYDESPMLRRFFNENNKVLAKAKLIIKENKSTLYTEWKVNVGDAIRYFGYFSPKQRLELNFEGGKKLVLYTKEKVYPAGNVKYPVSIYKITYELSNDALEMLRKYPISSATMVWQKKTETYESSNSQALMRLFLFSE